MSDAFSGMVDGVSAPATRGVAVVPHDANALADIPKALFVGVGGDLVARGLNDGGDVIFKNLAAGSVLPFRAQFVRATVVASTVPNVLVVPTAAVHYDKGEVFVTSADGDKIQFTPGAVGEDNTEVRSGLTAGQRVQTQ